MKKKRPAESRPIGMSNALTPDLRRRRQEYRKKRRLKASLLIFVSAVVLCCAAVFIISFMGANVISSITIEAGEEMVAASDFFDGDVMATFVSGNEIDTAIPGTYNITVRNGIMTHRVTLNVQDTVAPVAKPKTVRIRASQQLLKAEDFVKNIQDKTNVTASFEMTPDPSVPGDSDVIVILTDAGGNETRYTAKLTVFPEEISPTASVEAGNKSFSVRSFLTDDAPEYEGDTILTEIPDGFINKVGSTKLEIMYNSAVYTVTATVEDTVPPAGYIVNQSVYKGTSIPASDFVTKFYDETEVTVSYSEEPDFDKIGQQVIGLVLEDGGKNTKTYRATLTVKADTTKPKITAEGRTVYIGDNIRFSEGVTATDNCDGEIPVTVDIGDFDKNTPGTYKIIFRAVDSSGNEAEKSVYFKLENKRAYQYTQEVIDSLFNPLYAKIIDDDMTDVEKMKAVYTYVRENISYTGTSEKSDWEQEAYRGLRSKSGDAFTFYAISRKLLTMAGIENKEVQRVGSDSAHYWNMVKYNGQWYHFDTCPHYKDYPIDSFMLTDKEAAEYSKKTGGYYKYK